MGKFDVGYCRKRTLLFCMVRCRYNTPAIEQGACLFQYGRFQQCALGRVDLLPSEQIEASPWRMVERHDLAFEREHPDACDGVVDAGARNARKQGQGHLVQWLLQSSMEQFGSDIGFFVGELSSNEESSFRHMRLQKHAVQGHCLDTDERIDQGIHVAITLQYVIGLPHGWREAVPEIVRDVFGARLIHAFLVFEVVLQCRRVDPGGGGDVACRSTGETMLAEQLDSRGDDSLARFVATCVTARRGATGTLGWTHALALMRVFSCWRSNNNI